MSKVFMYSSEVLQELTNACEENDDHKLNSILSSISSEDLPEYAADLTRLLKDAILDSQFAIAMPILRLEVMSDFRSKNGDELYDLAIEAAKKYEIDIAYELFQIPSAREHAVNKFHQMVYSEDVEAVEEFVRLPIPNEILLAKSPRFDERNALQIAFQEKCEPMVELLLDYDIFKDSLTTKDLYGRTARDIAVENDFEEGLKLLSTDFELEDAGDNVGFKDLCQEKIDEKLIKYLDDKGAKGNTIVDEEGNCNGWSFLYQIYVTSGREEEFYDVLNAIAEWDGESTSMEDSPLPESLKAKYASKAALFEQIVNDLAVYHYNTPASDELKLGWRQESRIEQYELTKDPKVGRELRKLSDYDGRSLTREQLVEMLDHFSRWPGTSIDIGGGQHATSLYVSPDGQLKYFDPNLKNKIEPFRSTEQLADFIIKYKYDMIGKRNLDGTVDITLTPYKFYEKTAVIPPVELPTLPSKYHADTSPNKFTDLHMAIIENNPDKVKQALNENEANVAVKDAHGNTPLHLAISGKNEEILNLILNAKNLDINQPNLQDIRPLEMAMKSNNVGLVKKILDIPTLKLEEHKGALFAAIVTGNPQMLEVVLSKGSAALDPNQTLGDETTPILMAVNKGNVEVVKQLIETYGNKINLNAKDFMEWTPLMNAARRGNVEMVQLLLSKGADINIKDVSNQTVFDMAKHQPKILAILQKHQDEARHKTEKVAEPTSHSPPNSLVSMYQMRRSESKPLRAQSDNTSVTVEADKKGPSIR